MYTINLQYDPDIITCDFNGINVESNGKISTKNIKDVNQLICYHDNGNKYLGAACVGDPSTVIDDFKSCLKEQDGEENIYMIVPVFEENTKKEEEVKGNEEGKKENTETPTSTITIMYNTTPYYYTISEATSIRTLIEKDFPSDQYNIAKIHLVNNSTKEEYTIDDPIDKEGVYIIDYLDPYITFVVDGTEVKFSDNPSAKTKTLPLSAGLPKVDIAAYYTFNMWTSPEGNWDNINTILKYPTTFTASAYKKQWTVTFEDCGDTVKKTVENGDYVTVPNCSKEGNTFTGWKEKFSVPSCNIIIVYLLIIVFIICVVVLFIRPLLSSQAVRRIQSKTSH